MTRRGSGTSWLPGPVSAAPMALLIAATAFSAWLLQDNAPRALAEDPVSDDAPDLIIVVAPHPPEKPASTQSRGPRSALFRSKQ